MTQVIAGVHEVHLTNAGQRQTAADPQTRPTDLRCLLTYLFTYLLPHRKKEAEVSTQLNSLYKVE